MDKVLEQLIREVPSLSIVGFIVWVFVKYLIQSSQSVRDVHLDTMRRMEKLAADTHASMAQCHTTQMRSATALEQNAEALDRFGDKISHLSDMIERGYVNGGTHR